LRTLYIVTYDIREAGRLYRVGKTMKGYGDRMQYSVFRCELSDRERVELTAKLSEIMKHDEDQVLFFPLGPAGGFREGQVHFIGLPYEPLGHSANVI